MKFSDLYKEAMNIFSARNKMIRWITTYHDPLKVNLGHTIPGSFGEETGSGNSFEEIKEFVRSKRIYINETEEFRILSTCAFTVEARLVDTNDPDLPNTLFHIITTFSNGKKEILTNFNDIFRTVGMDYML